MTQIKNETLTVRKSKQNGTSMRSSKSRKKSHPGLEEAARQRNLTPEEFINLHIQAGIESAADDAAIAGRLIIPAIIGTLPKDPSKRCMVLDDLLSLIPVSHPNYEVLKAAEHAADLYRQSIEDLAELAGRGYFKFSGGEWGFDTSTLQRPAA